MGKKATIQHLLGDRESFSRNVSIKDHQAEGKDTTGHICINRHDEYGTVIFVERPEEVPRAVQVYDKYFANRVHENLRNGARPL